MHNLSSALLNISNLWTDENFIKHFIFSQDTRTNVDFPNMYDRHNLGSDDFWSSFSELLLYAMPYQD